MLLNGPDDSSVCVMSSNASGRHYIIIIIDMKLERNGPRENQIVCRSSLLYREHVCIAVRPGMELPTFSVYLISLVCVQTVRMRIM